MFCLWYYDMQDGKRYKDISFWGIFAVFFLLSGLRYRIGMDTHMYMNSWGDYGDMWDFHWIDDITRFQQKSEYVSRFQPGWVLYCIIIRGFSKDFTLLQLVTSFIFNFAMFRMVKEYSKRPFLTLLMFFISFKFIEFEFEIMREGVAVGIFLLFAFDAYMKKKWVKYYIWTFVAFMLHTSAVLMFALPLLRNVDWKVWKYSLFFVLPGFIIGIAGRLIFGDLVNVFLGGGDDFISQYTSSAFEKENNVNYAIMYGLQPTLLYLLTAFNIKRIENREFIPLMFFAISFMYMGMFYFTAARLVNYIIVIVFIGATPIMQYLIRRFRTMWVVPVLMIIYFLPTLYSFREPRNLARYYPYQWVIDPKQTPLQKTI